MIVIINVIDTVRIMKNNETIVVYIDEAWRGPIAGPVTVGLVVGSKSTDRSWYADSKSLTAKRRQELANMIKSDSSIIRTTWSASAKEVDRNGIIRALRRAIIRWLYSLIKKIYHNNTQLQWKWCYHKKLLNIIKSGLGIRLIIDGNHSFWLDTELWINVQTIIKWDRDVPQISAASILAKTTRDAEMIKLWANYPWYGFEQHMWYGTRKHYAAIEELGVCEIHRKKWIK